MNKFRRKDLKEVLKSLGGLKGMDNKAEVLSILEWAHQTTQICADEEEDSFNNLPESFQFSSRADRFTEAMDELTDAYCEIEDLAGEVEGMEQFDYKSVLPAIESITAKIQNAIGK